MENTNSKPPLPTVEDMNIDWEGLQESSKTIERLLNEIIQNEDITLQEAKKNAALCLNVLNNYTATANKNIHLLNEQAQMMLKKVKQVLMESQIDDQQVEIN